MGENPAESVSRAKARSDSKHTTKLGQEQGKGSIRRPGSLPLREQVISEEKQMRGRLPDPILGSGTTTRSTDVHSFTRLKEKAEGILQSSRRFSFVA